MPELKHLEPEALRKAADEVVVPPGPVVVQPDVPLPALAGEAVVRGLPARVVAGPAVKVRRTSDVRRT